MAEGSSAFDERLNQVNQSLDRLTIRRKGDRLYARGTFPPKPGEDTPKQRDIPLKCRATLAELKIAKARAQKIDGDLVENKFEWTAYLKPTQRPPQTCGEWIDRLERHHWQITPKTVNKENSWQKNYRLYLNKLPPELPLTADLLVRLIVERSQSGTRAREFYCLAYRKLAEFAAIEGIDFKSLRRGYRVPCVDPDRLPSDERILEVRAAIAHPGWQWIFGILCTYGIRPSEVFRLDTSKLHEVPGILKVLENTKTGYRLVWPCPSRWWSEFRLWEVTYPNITTEGKSNNTLGERIGGYFYSKRLGFSPSDLRDAYGIRSGLYGVPLEYAAKWMGHSVEVHCKHYLDAINQRHHEQVFRQMQEHEIKVWESVPPEDDGSLPKI